MKVLHDALISFSLMYFFYGRDIYGQREPALSYKKNQVVDNSSPNKHYSIADFLFVNSLSCNLKKGTYNFL